MESNEDFWKSTDLTKSNIQLANNVEKKITPIVHIKHLSKRIKLVIKEVTVEPSLSLYMLCIAISSLAVQTLNIEKACRVNYNYGDENCTKIMAGDTEDLKEEVEKVQALVANVVAWKFPLQTFIPAAMVLFIGAWSDRTKKRKVCMLTPFVGEMISNIGLIMATYFLNEWPLEATALIEALPPALTGSYVIMFVGMYSYMADITTMQDRTFRLGIVTVFVALGTPAGTAISGILLSRIGYYGVFGLLFCLHGISLAYGLVRIQDVVLTNEQEIEVKKNSGCRKFFSLKPVLETFLVVFRPRAGWQRFQICSVIIMYFLMVGPLYGDSQVSYLYARYKFNFDAVEFSLYTTGNVLLGLCGTIFCIYVLSKRLGIEDSMIGILAATSRIASSLVLAFAPTRNWFYSAPAFGIFSSTGLTAVRSMASKFVASEDVAKLSSMIGVSEAFAPSVYMPISSKIYVTTMRYLPGAFYLFDASLTVVAMGFFLSLYILARKSRASSENRQVTRM